MIFITLGSQKFQFNRLLKEVDRLIEETHIKEEVFAQIGYSDYEPKNFKYERFLDREEFNEGIRKCEILITHGGTGAIIAGVKNKKRVIAIPRSPEFNEHVDYHQVQIVTQFFESETIEACYEISELEKLYKDIRLKTFKKYESNTFKYIDQIKRIVENY